MLIAAAFFFAAAGRRFFAAGFAFAFFFACVFYVLRKRVLGPLDPITLAWQAITTLINTVLNTAASTVSLIQPWSVKQEHDQQSVHPAPAA